MKFEKNITFAILLLSFVWLCKAQINVIQNADCYYENIKSVVMDFTSAEEDAPALANFVVEENKKSVSGDNLNITTQVKEFVCKKASQKITTIILIE